MSLATARYTPFSHSLASQLPRGWLSRRCLFIVPECKKNYCKFCNLPVFLFFGYWANPTLHRTAVTGVTYVKEKPDLILMHDDNTIAVLDKEKDMPEPSAKVIGLKLVGAWCRKFIIRRFELIFSSLSIMIHDRHHQTTSPRMVHPTVQVLAPVQPKRS